MTQNEADLLAALSDLNVHLRISLKRIHAELGVVIAGISASPAPEPDRDYRLRHLESLAAQLNELVCNDRVTRSLPIDLGPDCEVLERVNVSRHQPPR
jgi:hypothetical protein